MFFKLKYYIINSVKNFVRLGEKMAYSGNFVAKYDWQVNKAKTFIDRKRLLKRGYKKHKGKNNFL